jgi:L-lactate dehydrogenase complex protein LldG
MSSREAILQRIHSALAKGTVAGSADAAAAQPANAAVLSPPPVPQVWPRENPDAGRMADRFVDELKAVHGETIRCRSMDQARTELAEMVRAAEWPKIGAIAGPLVRDVATNLPAEQLAWIDDRWAPPDIAQLSAGIISPVTLLADTGSCVFACNTAQQRLMCYLPPVCVVIARVEQLVEHLPAAWETIGPQCAEPDRRGELVIVTGPSRTADIEKILILGVHGPKRLVVVLVG